MQKISIPTLILSLLLFSRAALAESADMHVTAMTKDWAAANYELAGDEQETAFETLITRSEAAVAAYPREADILIWNGIIKSSYAGIRGGLGALSLAKQARKSLETAMKIDDRAMSGSAYSSLGTLYFKVPRWPLGFGSDKKAVQLLRKALKINPDGIDSNYFYADYLLHKKKFEQAEQYLLKARQAAPRADQPVADAGRQDAIDIALAEARKKLRRTAMQ